MKRTYVRPTMVGERFVANEYVAACGDSGKVYNFECNAGQKGSSYNVYFADGTPYASSNGDEEWHAPFSGFHPCGASHSAESDSGFKKGYMYLQKPWGFGAGDNTGDPIQVIIWTDKGRDVHCTKNLDMKKWETAKS